MEFSDAGYASCSHHTCLWLPFSAHKTFTRGALKYAVDVTGNDNDAMFVLRRGNAKLLRTPLKNLSGSTSVVWSEDDKNFAVTWSQGGSIGPFHVRAFHVEGDTITELPVPTKAFDSFKARHWCRTRGDNIQAYNWYPDSQSLVLVLSVYPTGDCGKGLGHTEGFVVNATTGEIREHWDIKQLSAYLKSHPE